MPELAGDFLTGSVLSLVMPLALLAIVLTAFWLSLRRRSD
jgi:hypothetical protein